MKLLSLRPSPCCFRMWNSGAATSARLRHSLLNMIGRRLETSLVTCWKRWSKKQREIVRAMPSRPLLPAFTGRRCGREVVLTNSKLRTVAPKAAGWRDRYAATPEASRPTDSVKESEPLKGAYFWLTVFYVVYCARPEDWIPGLHSVPLAKISGVFAILGLLLSVGRSLAGLEGWCILSHSGFLQSVRGLGAHLPGRYQPREAPSRALHPGRFRGRDLDCFDGKGRLSSAAGWCPGRNLFESQ